MNQAVNLFHVIGHQGILNLPGCFYVVVTKIQQQFAVKLSIALQPVQPSGKIETRQ